MSYPREFDSELYQYMGKSYTPINRLTPFVQSWILEHFPKTTHIRLTKYCGSNTKHQVWIGCWNNPVNEKSKPIWTQIFYTQEIC
jgi:hypothetical protein